MQFEYGQAQLPVFEVRVKGLAADDHIFQIWRAMEIVVLSVHQLMTVFLLITALSFTFFKEL